MSGRDISLIKINKSKLVVKSCLFTIYYTLDFYAFFSNNNLRVILNLRTCTSREKHLKAEKSSVYLLEQFDLQTFHHTFVKVMSKKVNRATGNMLKYTVDSIEGKFIFFFSLFEWLPKFSMHVFHEVIAKNNLC